MYNLEKSLVVGAALLAGGAIAANAGSNYDGSYLGTMTQMETTSQLGNTEPACEYSRLVNMTVEGDNVTVVYLDWGNNTIHYRGALGPTGALTAWHTNGDGSRSVLTGQIGPAGFTGYMDRDHQACPYEVTLQPVAPRTPAR
jgi:hypothetical protein